jgi:hypothetical protein
VAFHRLEATSGGGLVQMKSALTALQAYSEQSSLSIRGSPPSLRSTPPPAIASRSAASAKRPLIVCYRLQEVHRCERGELARGARSAH